MSILNNSNEKSPGPDDFRGKFFKVCRDIVGREFTNVVKSFFTNHRWLNASETNQCLITHVPKKKGDTTMGNFKSISWCNTTSKAISKISANSLTPVLCLKQFLTTNLLYWKGDCRGKKFGFKFLRGFNSTCRGLEKLVSRLILDIAMPFDTKDWFALDLTMYNFECILSYSPPFSWF